MGMGSGGIVGSGGTMDGGCAERVEEDEELPPTPACNRLVESASTVAMSVAIAA